MRKKPIKDIDPNYILEQAQQNNTLTQALLDELPPLHTIRNKSNGKKVLTPKRKRFAKEYAKTLNGVQSALKAYDTTDSHVASEIAQENLRNPVVRAEVERLLANNDIKLPEILSIHKRNMLQTKHLPTSQKAVSDFYSILGLHNTEKPTSEIKIAFIIEK